MNESTCPVCSGAMYHLDVPTHYGLRQCEVCGELAMYLPDGQLALVGPILERAALNDDRLRVAMSTPHVSSVKSFLDIFENATRAFQFELAAAQGGLRTVLAQVENRLDFALSQFSGLDLASDEAGDGLRALREARELMSTLPRRSRGVAQEAIKSDGASE